MYKSLSLSSIGHLAYAHEEVQEYLWKASRTLLQGVPNNAEGERAKRSPLGDVVFFACVYAWCGHCVPPKWLQLCFAFCFSSDVSIMWALLWKWCAPSLNQSREDKSQVLVTPAAAHVWASLNGFLCECRLNGSVHDWRRYTYIYAGDAQALVCSVKRSICAHTHAHNSAVVTTWSSVRFLTSSQALIWCMVPPVILLLN